MQPKSYWDYVWQYQQQHADPREAWLQALQAREQNKDPELANAEHFLWNRYYSQQGPMQALGGLLTPYGYYAAKKTGLLDGTPANLRQLQAGLQGAFSGLGWGE